MFGEFIKKYNGPLHIIKSNHKYDKEEHSDKKTEFRQRSSQCGRSNS